MKIKVKLKRIGQNLLTILYPRRCPSCEKVIRQDKIFCDECSEDLPGVSYRIYAKGGFPCVSAAPYKDTFSRAVVNFKFHGRRQYARQLATLTAEVITKEYSDISFDLITFVPLHPKNMKIRGYNQSELLAKELSDMLDIPLADTLHKTRFTPPQHTLTGSKRAENVRGAYRLNDKNLIKNKNILLIDDVITTGNTLGECAKTLDTCAAASVRCATFAVSVVKTT